MGRMVNRKISDSLVCGESIRRVSGLTFDFTCNSELLDIVPVTLEDVFVRVNKLRGLNYASPCSYWMNTILNGTRCRGYTITAVILATYFSECLGVRTLLVADSRLVKGVEVQMRTVNKWRNPFDFSPDTQVDMRRGKQYDVVVYDKSEMT